MQQVTQPLPWLHQSVEFELGQLTLVVTKEDTRITELKKQITKGVSRFNNLALKLRFVVS
jgi:hypothetical protein